MTVNAPCVKMQCALPERRCVNLEIIDLKRLTEAACTPRTTRPKQAGQSKNMVRGFTGAGHNNIEQKYVKPAGKA